MNKNQGHNLAAIGFLSKLSVDHPPGTFRMAFFLKRGDDGKSK